MYTLLHSLAKKKIELVSTPGAKTRRRNHGKRKGRRGKRRIEGWCYSCGQTKRDRTQKIHARRTDGLRLRLSVFQGSQWIITCYFSKYGNIKVTDSVSIYTHLALSVRIRLNLPPTGSKQLLSDLSDITIKTTDARAEHPKIDYRVGRKKNRTKEKQSVDKVKSFIIGT